MPRIRFRAICACIAPMVPTTGPRTPAVAQLAPQSGASGNTARKDGALPQKAPT